MRNGSTGQFHPFSTALVPVLNDCDVTAALAAASAVAEQVILVGLVTASQERGLSANTKEARALRRRMRELAAQSERVRRSDVLVGVEPWIDLVRYIAAHTPDLLVMDWDAHFECMDLAQRELLTSPPCDVALVRG
ncbi:MAG: hypothetical protein KDE45_20595, partial [Caldilineaceae bacterium]|nr:hypothetical protein [Caldilineaceae bacterium]